MYVVAIVELGGSIDDEAAAMAADLGVTAYEARLVLAGGVPAIALMTADGDRARGLLERLRARGHGAIACDASHVVPSSAMVGMRRFALLDDAVVAEDHKPEPIRLPFDDVLAFFPATHRVQVERRTEEKSRKFAPVRAVMSSGLTMTKNVTKATHSTTVARERILYVFRRSGALPWLLRESGTSYVGLGAAMGPSATENFQTTVRRMRERAPSALYDERLLHVRRVAEHAKLAGNAAQSTVTTSSEAGVDLAAHLLAIMARRP